MIFLDSSFIISFEVESDQNHVRAVEVLEEIKKGDFGERIVSDYIFDEVVTVSFGRTKSLEKSVFVGNKIRESLNILRVDDSVFEEAWKIFKSQKETKLSFTDCSTLALMERSGIKNIATFDEDYKKIKEINVVD